MESLFAASGRRGRVPKSFQERARIQRSDGGIQKMMAIGRG